MVRRARPSRASWRSGSYLESTPRRKGTLLAGLEHLDERYLRAVGYSTKSKRGALPKMVLLGDIVGEDEAAVAAATSQVVRLANARSGEGFIAVSAEARRKFWLDRAKTAAIAKHTNAFKINEDVVIPLERLGEYTDAIERINIELSIRNKLELLGALEQYFSRSWSSLPRCGDAESTAPSRGARSPGRACARAGSTCSATWMTPEGESRHSLFDRLQDRSIRVSWKTEVRATLARIFVGSAFAPMLAECDAMHKRILQGRVFVALHMHAGDGNVHTNIPVNSDNYAMLHTANRAVAKIMRIARALNGVISGEHGIGITKLEYLTEAELAAFRAYKQRVDPRGSFQQAQIDAARRFAPRLYAELRPAGARIADHAAIGHQQHFRCHQGLPALRQMQTRLRHACAARESAVFAARQDSCDFAADRSLPL